MRDVIYSMDFFFLFLNQNTSSARTVNIYERTQNYSTFGGLGRVPQFLTVSLHKEALFIHLLWLAAPASAPPQLKQYIMTWFARLIAH